MENNEKKYEELLEFLNEAQKEPENDKTNEDQKNLSKDEVADKVTEDDTNGFIEDEKTEAEQIELDNNVDADDDFGFVEDNSNDVAKERCNKSDIVGDDDNQNYKFFVDENDTPVNELSDEKRSQLEDIMNSNVNTDSENTEIEEEEHTKTPDPIVIGHPIPTDLLNPELATKEQERKNNQDELKKSDFDIPAGLLSEDYTELFNSYNKIIETLDNNINYVIHRIQVANRKIWISYGIAIVAIIIAILK